MCNVTPHRVTLKRVAGFTPTSTLKGERKHITDQEYTMTTPRRSRVVEMPFTPASLGQHSKRKHAPPEVLVDQSYLDNDDHEEDEYLLSPSNKRFRVTHPVDSKKGTVTPSVTPSATPSATPTAIPTKRGKNVEDATTPKDKIISTPTQLDEKLPQDHDEDNEVIITKEILTNPFVSQKRKRTPSVVSNDEDKEKDTDKKEVGDASKSKEKDVDHDHAVFLFKGRKVRRIHQAIDLTGYTPRKLDFGAPKSPFEEINLEEYAYTDDEKEDSKDDVQKDLKDATKQKKNEEVEDGNKHRETEEEYDDYDGSTSSDYANCEDGDEEAFDEPQSPTPLPRGNKKVIDIPIIKDLPSYDASLESISPLKKSKTKLTFQIWKDEDEDELTDHNSDDGNDEDDDEKEEDNDELRNNIPSSPPPHSTSSNTRSSTQRTPTSNRRIRHSSPPTNLSNQPTEIANGRIRRYDSEHLRNSYSILVHLLEREQQQPTPLYIDTMDSPISTENEIPILEPSRSGRRNPFYTPPPNIQQLQQGAARPLPMIESEDQEHSEIVGRDETETESNTSQEVEQATEPEPPSTQDIRPTEIHSKEDETEVDTEQEEAEEINAYFEKERSKRLSSRMF